MDWPPQSPDLNPIEQLWDHLDRQLRLKSSSNADQTFTTLQKLWSEIPLNVLEVYVNSMHMDFKLAFKRLFSSMRFSSDIVDDRVSEF